MVKFSKKISYNNKGSAIITALVVSTVVMILCLSLLAVSYSLFLSQKTNTSDLSQKELFYSSIELFEHELLDSIYVDPATDTSLLPADGSIKTGFDGSAYGKAILENVCTSLDSYIKNGFAQNSGWLYFDGSVTGHNDKDNCSKYYYLRSLGSVNIIAQMFWELPSLELTPTNQEKEGTVIHVIYRLYNSNMEVQIKNERVYRLTKTRHESGGGVAGTSAYSIEFKSKNTSYQDCVPSPVYFDTLGSAPILNDGSLWYNWYTDVACTQIYDNTTLTDDMFVDAENNPVPLILYTDWDNSAPIKVDFVVNGVCKKRIIAKAGNIIDQSEAPVPPAVLETDSSDLFIRWCCNNGKGNQISSDSFFDENDGKSAALDNRNYLVFAMYSSYFTNSSYTNIKNGKVPGHNGKNIDYDELTNAKSFFSYSWERVMDA